MEALSYLYMTDVQGAGRTRERDAPIDRLIKTFKTWARRYTQRRELARVDAALLADFGVTPSQAALEVGKPFWRA